MLLHATTPCKQAGMGVMLQVMAGLNVVFTLFLQTYPPSLLMQWVTFCCKGAMSAHSASSTAWGFKASSSFTLGTSGQVTE